MNEIYFGKQLRDIINKYEDFKNTFITHINSFNPDKKISKSDFENIDKTIQDTGKIPNTNNLFLFYQSLQDTGLFAELSVAVFFALLSTFFGWVFICKKRKLIKNVIKEIYEISNNYTSLGGNFNNILDKLLQKKSDVLKQIQSNLIKYEEGIFILLYINDQIKKVEKYYEINELTVSFQSKFREFLADGELDKKEYKLLLELLETLKTNIKPEVYLNLTNELHSIYQKTKNIGI